MPKVLIMGLIEESVLKEVDKFIKDTGVGSTRSGFVREAVEFYLKVKKIK